MAIKTTDFLLEIGTEEIPANMLNDLAKSLADEVIAQIKKKNFSYSLEKIYSTPRRIALKIEKIAQVQPDVIVEKKGPSEKSAFHDGQPTKALEAFAKSCHTTIDQLKIKENSKGRWFFYETKQKGFSIEDVLPEIIKESISKLSLKKSMQWGYSKEKFVRPVHWVVLLVGEKIVPCEILGCKTGNMTYGHRVYCPQAIHITSPQNYELQLLNGKVVADFCERKNRIIEQIKQIQKSLCANVDINTALIDEVVNLVEWPVVILGDFEKKYLSVPHEILEAAIQKHQKCFNVYDKNGSILPYFISVANIETQNKDLIIQGYKKVIRSRLEDARFFYSEDKKTTLSVKSEKLKQVIFHNKLGTIFEKSERVAWFSKEILALYLNKSDRSLAEYEKDILSAAHLMKADLVSLVVQEFPELQGMMGGRYAEEEKYAENVFQAIRDHYLPRFSGDKLPVSFTGNILALTDKVDTLVGLWRVGQIPTGSKDPFATRRNAVGILRILIENKIALPIDQLIEISNKTYEKQKKGLENKSFKEQLYAFIYDRFRVLICEKGMTVEIFSAIKSLDIKSPYDFYERALVTKQLCEEPCGKNLISAQKRINNILAKVSNEDDPIDPKNLKEKEEIELYKQLIEKEANIEKNKKNYKAILAELLSLEKNITCFFEKVLVNVDSEIIKKNRYALLRKAQKILQSIADFEYLTR